MHVGDSEHVVNNTACPMAVSAELIAQNRRIVVPCNLVGSYIGVHLTSGEPLTFCEVQAYHGTSCLYT